MKKLFLQGGKIYVGEFPEEPKWHEIPATPSGCDYEIRDEQRDEYNSAVSAAKDSAVEVVDMAHGFYKALLNSQNIATGEGSEQEVLFALNSLQEGQLYDTPEGWTVEMYRQEETGPGDDQYEATKARLIPVKEPENLIASQMPYPESSGIAAIGKAHIDDGTKLGKWVKITSMKRYPGSPFFCKVMDVDGVTHEQVPLIKVKIKTIIPDENPSGTVATGVPERDTTANDRTEPTVNTIIDRIGELYEGLKDLHHAQEVYDKSGEFFASLQELRNIACVAVKSVSPPPQTESRHKYEPEPEHPQFCRQCGYAEHVKLKHF